VSIVAEVRGLLCLLITSGNCIEHRECKCATQNRGEPASRLELSNDFHGQITGMSFAGAGQFRTAAPRCRWRAEAAASATHPMQMPREPATPRSKRLLENLLCFQTRTPDHVFSGGPSGYPHQFSSERGPGSPFPLALIAGDSISGNRNRSPRGDPDRFCPKPTSFKTPTRHARAALQMANHCAPAAAPVERGGPKPPTRTARRIARNSRATTWT